MRWETEQFKLVAQSSIGTAPMSALGSVAHAKGEHILLQQELNFMK